MPQMFDHFDLDILTTISIQFQLRSRSICQKIRSEIGWIGGSNVHGSSLLATSAPPTTKFLLDSTGARAFISNFPRELNFRSGNKTPFLLHLETPGNGPRGHPTLRKRLRLPKIEHTWLLWEIYFSRKQESAIDRSWKWPRFKGPSCTNSLLEFLTLLYIKGGVAISAPLGATAVFLSSIFVCNWGEFFASREKLWGVWSWHSWVQILVRKGATSESDEDMQNSF